MAVQKTVSARQQVVTNAEPMSGPVAAPAKPVPPIEEGGVSPFMISSLPSQASGADVYARQFYRGSRVPFRRYLPLNGL